MGLLEIATKPEDYPYSSEIKITSRRKFAMFSKYLNTIITSFALFYVTFPQMVVYLYFTSDEANDDIQECIFPNGNYIIPYHVDCTRDTLFELNEAITYHRIQRNSDCLPDYLFNKTIRLQGFKYSDRREDDNFELLNMTPSILGLQQYACFIILVFMLPLLFLLDELQIHLKLSLKHGTIGYWKYFYKTLFVFLQYQVIIDSFTFGTINVIMHQECCPAVYNPGNHPLPFIIYFSTISLIITTVPCILFLLVTIMYKTQDAHKIFIGLTLHMFRKPLFVTGLYSLIYNLAISIETIFILPSMSALSVPSFAFYNGGIGKLILLILSFENFLHTFGILETLSDCFLSKCNQSARVLP
jgi:hypothetical protein